MSDKKIKLKNKYLMGRKEYDRYFLSNGIWMFDVSEHLENLPDDVQLAFQLWPKWNKYGKDQPFRPETDDKVTEIPSWFNGVLTNHRATDKGKPCPLLHASADDTLYRAISNYNSTFWAFVSESAYQLALELWDESEIEFFIGESPETPVSVEFASRRVGTIAQSKGVPEKLLAWGFPHFLRVESEVV